MIYEVEGDIMLTRAPVIALGVAVDDTMTRGLARSLHEKFPVMVQEYRDWCHETSPEPGELWFWSAPGKIQIAALITHGADDDPARPRRPERIALNRSFRALNRLATERRFPAIAMPPIGAGEFGLDWGEVRGMMDSQLGDLLYPIFIYTKQLDGQVAHEPGM